MIRALAASVLALGLLLIPAGWAAAAETATVSLDKIAADALEQRFPATVDEAPARITLDPALRAALAALPVDGGREKTVYLKFEAGRLSFDRALLGGRYRATARCGEDCNYPQPIRAHTHPYENPFSVLDLTIVAERRIPSIVAVHGGRLYLALPTGIEPPWGAFDPFFEFRHAVFGNRLECPARKPPGGYTAPTPMGRNVEAVMRAAADSLAVAIYVSDGGDFRRLDGPAPTDPLLKPHRRIDLTDLSAHERAWLRLVSLADANRRAKQGETLPGSDLIDPSRPDPVFDGLMAAFPQLQAEGGGEALKVMGAMQAFSDGRWFKPLPTTVYLADPFRLDATEVPFASVQWSADCRDLLVLEGRQSFAPDGVVYTRGWSRPARFDGADTEGWRPIAAGKLPKGHLVPWGSSQR